MLQRSRRSHLRSAHHSRELAEQLLLVRIAFQGLHLRSTDIGIHALALGVQILRQIFLMGDVHLDLHGTVSQLVEVQGPAAHYPAYVMGEDLRERLASG